MSAATERGSVAGLRVAISAGAGGIGRAMARAFAAAGARVAVCDVNAAAVADLRAELPGALAVVADVGAFDEVRDFFRAIADTFGGLDTLINNAGIAGPTGPAQEIDPEAWDHTLRVTLGSAFYCSRQAIAMLREAGGGAIINIASNAVFSGYPFRAPYAAAKWGLIGLTKTLAMELGAHGIRVNAICPGSVSGARMEGVMQREAEARGVALDVVRTSFLRQVSMRCFIPPEDIASLAMYLASPAGARISGQAIGLDGHTETLQQWQGE
ncbi:MAG: SDR family oxidoreductase [Myxococcales bacterium]|nr:SDR family oxidoreductase [Myxococcales bacterium]MDH5306277.1 SDR family oxidoreductase [Myxococcales bacterium]MDH5566788.1 SDR family oxidoreductase [Myxococcales bacterium]